MYPQSNSARSVQDLSGVWDFRFNANEPWQPIAVPASYNDQSPDPEFRRHYGMAYYRTTFTVPEGARRVLRFDAVTHNAVVRLNGQEIASHRGGFLPFEADITALAQPGETVTLDVEVDNRIGHSSLPVGNEGGTAFFGSDNAGIPAVEAGKARQQAQGINLPNFDFFNYAGITRPVHLYTTPAAYIRDVTVAADMTGTLRYTVDTVGEGSVKVEILDAEDRVVACADGAAGTVQVENARLWQPRPGTPYLYTALVRFGKDEYRQKFGFRSVEVSGHKFLINGAPFYFKGPCKHEDSAFRGRGYDACVTVTDLKLYEWLNANCLRMSHYPYAEEVYDLCDRLGIVVIDETPAVGIGAGAACDPYQTFPLKTYHSAVLRAMIERDKNHPCVVLWSLGNEPDTEHFPEGARDYWRPFDVDLSDRAKVDTFVQVLAASAPAPTHFIHLPALPVVNAKFKAFDQTRFDRDLEIQVHSAVRLCRAVLPAMAKARFGRVLFIQTSYTIGCPPKNTAAYVMAKSAIGGLVKSLAVEYARFGVTVNCVAPSMMETNFLKDTPDLIVQAAAEENPMGRNATPADVVPAMAFLLSDEAGFITGVTLPVTGGSAIV